MRFGIICAMSLLVAPTLVTSKSESPPPQHSPPPPPPSSPILPTHGDLVRYQAHAPHAGIVVGSQPDRAGNVNIAPLAPPESQRPGHTAFFANQVVNAHPANIVHMGGSSLHVADDLASHHARRPPSVLYTTEHVPGSPNHRVAQSNSRGRGSGSQRSERTWRHRRR